MSVIVLSYQWIVTAPREEEEEQEVKRKPIFYEELRIKNRENYDITRNQKIDRDIPIKEGESCQSNCWICCVLLNSLASFSKRIITL